MKYENTIENYFIKNVLDLNRILEDYTPYITKILGSGIYLSKEDQEEIISDVLLVIWKNKDKLDKSKKLSPYIASVTKKIMYQKNAKKNLANLEIDYDIKLVDNFNMEKILEEKEINELIIRNVKEIGLMEYKIFTKFYYEGKKIKQIAKELGLNTSTVKTKLHRTRKKVKEILRMGGF